MKKLSTLLTHRAALLRQARLANVAFAYDTLYAISGRIARARLGGQVNLRSAAPEAERFLATLTAVEGHQSVIDEHFTDDQVMELSDVLAFVMGTPAVDVAFRLEELGEVFLPPLRAELEDQGIEIDRPLSPLEAQSNGDA